MTRRHTIAIFFLLSLTATVPAFSAAGAVPSLGRVDFPNSGAGEAQSAFIRGVLLLHSFEYEDAREAFQEARTSDPDFALAAWGEAMTHNHPLWRQRDREAAMSALERLAGTREERLAKAPTDREKGYLLAVETLYEEGEKVARDQAYSEAMRTLSQAYPEDLEAKSFYALSILGTTQGVRDFASYMRAGAIVEEVFAVNPLHPGAAHYLIHSYDDPVHAPLGLRAARVYAQIAPAASHAQHMISHIFVALGRWDESVASNIQAFSVSEERAQRKELSVDSLNFHALQWLAYSYLQLGRYNEAREQLSKIVAYAQESGSTRARWYQAVMDATWIVGTEGLGASTGPDLSTLPLNGKAQSLFAAGHAAYVAGNPALANEAYSRLRDALEVASPKPTGEQPDIYTAGSKGEILVARILERSLGGLVTLRAGREQEALEMFEEATALESERPLAFGPPSIVKPSHELYGEVLLALDRPDLARHQFEKALERAPGRSLSLAGLARAAHAAGDEATKAKACKELENTYAAADDSVGPPTICTFP